MCFEFVTMLTLESTPHNEDLDLMHRSPTFFFFFLQFDFTFMCAYMVGFVAYIYPLGYFVLCFWLFFFYFILGQIFRPPVFFTLFNFNLNVIDSSTLYWRKKNNMYVIFKVIFTFHL